MLPVSNHQHQNNFLHPHIISEPNFHKVDEKNLKGTNVVPSSPRQFFERIYGHLERDSVPIVRNADEHQKSTADTPPVNSDKNDFCEKVTINPSTRLLPSVCDTTYQSDVSSSSPDILMTEKRWVMNPKTSCL